MTRIAQSIEVNVPLSTVYNQWTQFEDFPRFMEGVREVRQLDAAHLHWRADRNGTEIEWDSEITDQVPDHHIAWRDTSGPKNAGSIVFQPLQPDKTRIEMTIECDAAATRPDTEQATQAFASRIEQDLARFKKLLESQGSESGAWRGVVHQGRSMSSDDVREFDAADNPMQKPVGQTGKERDEAARSGTSPEHVAGGATSSFEFGDTGIGESGASGKQHAQSETGADRGAGSSSKPRGTHWLPNLLQGWEEPMVMVKKMSDEMDQLFDRFIGRPIASRFGQGGTSGKWMPPIEVVQLENRLVICVDLPGIRKEDVQIEVNRDRLTIEGERRDDRRQAPAQAYRKSERSYGPFYRMIPLPAEADADSAQASMRDGVLEIAIPLPTSAQRPGRRIDIQEPQ
jgi:HSP20 family molecular chaperone IbpA